MTFPGQRLQAAALLIASGGDRVTVEKILRFSSLSVSGEFFRSLLASMGMPP